ncbi:MAG: hypothetical protein ABSE36_05175 [Terracidiphilus sp.]|jgi:hypothetical protein
MNPALLSDSLPPLRQPAQAPPTPLPLLSLPFTMKSMFRSAFRPFCIALACLSLIAGTFGLRAQDDDSHHGRKYKAPPPSATISVTVVRAYNGKPIGDAHVIFHPIEGDKDKGALELKTNEDGKATIDVIPLGDTVTLQVIADGFQTYGQVYKIDKLNMAMEVRMNRPASQYSTYKNSAASSGSGNDSGSGKSSGSTPNSPPPDSNSKSGQSDPPSNSTPSQPPPK